MDQRQRHGGNLPSGCRSCRSCTGCHPHKHAASPRHRRRPCSGRLGYRPTRQHRRPARRPPPSSCNPRLARRRQWCTTNPAAPYTPRGRERHRPHLHTPLHPATTGPHTAAHHRAWHRAARECGTDHPRTRRRDTLRCRGIGVGSPQPPRRTPRAAAQRPIVPKTNSPSAAGAERRTARVATPRGRHDRRAAGAARLRQEPRASDARLSAQRTRSCGPSSRRRVGRHARRATQPHRPQPPRASYDAPPRGEMRTPATTAVRWATLAACTSPSPPPQVRAALSSGGVCRGRSPQVRCEARMGRPSRRTHPWQPCVQSISGSAWLAWPWSSQLAVRPQTLQRQQQTARQPMPALAAQVMPLPRVMLRLQPRQTMQRPSHPWTRPVRRATLAHPQMHLPRRMAPQTAPPPRSLVAMCWPAPRRPVRPVGRRAAQRRA